MIQPADIIKELEIYTAFFEGEFYPQADGLGYLRIWKYKYTESSIFAGKTIFCLERDRNGDIHGTLYDYSPILTTKITSENYRNFMSTFDVNWWDIKNKELTKEKMKEILKYNALAANTSDKIEKQINMFKNIETMF